MNPDVKAELLHFVNSVWPRLVRRLSLPPGVGCCEVSAHGILLGSLSPGETLDLCSMIRDSNASEREVLTLLSQGAHDEARRVLATTSPAAVLLMVADPEVAFSCHYPRKTRPWRTGVNGRRLELRTKPPHVREKISLAPAAKEGDIGEILAREDSVRRRMAASVATTLCLQARFPSEVVLTIVALAHWLT